MWVTNNPADIVTDKEMEYLKDADERQTRQFVAIIAERNGRHGVSLVCSVLDISRNTVYRGRHELQAASKCKVYLHPFVMEEVPTMPEAGCSNGVSWKLPRDWASTSGLPTIRLTAPNGTP